jgi:hypothetical protein
MKSRQCWGQVNYRCARVFIGLLQAKAKFFKIRPSAAKGHQKKSKKKAWISLDSIEPFQWVAATPWAKISFSAPFPPLAFAALAGL